MVTKPLIFQETRLFLDIDASNPQDRGKGFRNFDECELRAALSDQSGKPLEGFTLDRSKPLLESGRQEMSWQGADLSLLTGKPVRLRLEMRNCALYAIQFT